MKPAPETEQLLKDIANRQTELESLTSSMLSKHNDKNIIYLPNGEDIANLLNTLENISSLNTSISKAI
jgi:hypothetical protein